MLKSELDKLLSSCMFLIDRCVSSQELEQAKVATLGKNGRVTLMLKGLKDMEIDQRRELGAQINSIKEQVLQRLVQKFEELSAREMETRLSSEFVDISMPARDTYRDGRLHPITKVHEEILEIFANYGFRFVDGPDIDDEYNNFTAVNIPEQHPARTMHDTFYVNLLADDQGRKLLRTHTTAVENRALRLHGAPSRFFTIGRVFRSDYDATHTPMFTQIEGVVVDKDVGFAHLKWLLTDFLRKFFNADTVNLRIRPSFFPFTEPSIEVDIAYSQHKGKITLGSGENWMEICGGGVLHPTVLQSADIDSQLYRGMAFGFGLERLTSLKYGVPDLRGYFESDERWRKVFGFHGFTR